MRVSDFHFDLPKSLIAESPISPRDTAKLLVVSEPIADKHIFDLPALLQPEDILVFNDTKVLPVRLSLSQEGRHIEVTLHKHLHGSHWKAFAKPARKLHVGIQASVEGADNFYAQVLDKTEGEVTLAFNVEGTALIEKLFAYGAMPLPPYIKRKQGIKQEDFLDYQTIFARHEGAVAAPTAGLHFTPKLLAELNAKGIKYTFVTLHVGAGTFLPVKVEHIADHVMHSEYGIVSQEACDAILQARMRGGKVIAVGTTSLRILETAAASTGSLAPFSGETSIFITPGYRFHVIDRLLTNFHLPESTLLMLTSAIVGLERLKQVYAHAIANQYRFYSFGDACLMDVQPQAKGAYHA